MNKKFKVGKCYECANPEMGYVKIIDIVKKKATVTNGAETWTMVIKTDKDGDEFIQRNDVTPKFRGIYTYSAEWEI